MKRPVAISSGSLHEFSTYVAEAWRRFPDHLDPSEPVEQPPADALLSDPLPALRRYRQLASVRILWQDLVGQSDIADTGRAISALARRCLDWGLQAAEARVAERFGELRDAADRPIRLAVLGLGKLGGDELNFNSDLDLVLAYDGSGRSSGPRRLEASAWLKQVAQELIGIMDTVTAQGRVWIIDTRLRPFGDSGALVWSLPAMEQYFLSEGRTWERYAWLKAAPVAGDIETSERLLANLQPFIYRRYLDYGIFDRLRELYAHIDTNRRARSPRDDLKRGSGGIRALEFLIQSQQILRGGREPRLRERGFLPALAACRETGVLSDELARELEAAYSFLRILENRLQAMTGRQGHYLPDDGPGRERLAALMGHQTWSALYQELEHHRGRVRAQFSERFREPEAPAGSPDELWPPPEDLEQRLVGRGFADPVSAAAALSRLHRRIERRALSGEGRKRLARLMPRLLDETMRQSPPDTGLEDLLQLIEQIAQRSAYLALLYEHPPALARLVRVFRRSARLAEWIAEAPQLLDELLDPVHDLNRLTPPAVSASDQENGLNALARWRQAGYLHTALAELDDRLDAPAAAARLTDIAEAIIEQVLNLISENEPDLAVIGYGNLGARRVHYQSDLDLVFLHGDGPPPIRSAQKLISFMQMPLPGGRLFEIDTRLRPNGRAGLLVSSLDAFAAYQRDQAWTWEHQALIRARWVAGNPDLADAFETVRRTVLSTTRDPAKTREDLAAMRRRQQGERAESRVKRRLTDLQYIAELGILLRAADEPSLLDQRAPPEQFEALSAIGWLAREQARELSSAWQDLSTRRRRGWLERAPDPSLPAELENVVDTAWRLVFEPSEDPN
ncbi:MAG: bifunctional [glutamate--ammonia ligase]-adenylyl-L-tyrosine phosphorylase/[glutamate--ammonia-ligase] adenylyltransferase [Wenzhouxiangella sp.]|jgi:glutamate-ammonia-ligase adenylyltransferase|nr:bifunctional [glutamate--ammonia ligase]-adenylyl-L-tyrosine phosphorylase/[glutamate--ammonia-ligase] adenylyltransferase [Wenzhouxiangella sp.]